MPTFRTEHAAIQDPKAYDQEGGTCSGFTVLGAAHHLLGIEMPEQEVYELYTTAKLKQDGMSVRDLCRAIHLNPLESEDGKHSLTVKDSRKVYNGRAKSDLAQAKLRYELMNAARFPHIAIVFGLKFFGEKPEKKPMKLDDNGFLLPNDYPTHYGLHAQYLIKNLETRSYLWESEEGLYVRVMNSWGSDFGGKGEFPPGAYGIYLKDFYRVVDDVIKIEFSDPKQFQK